MLRLAFSTLALLGLFCGPAQAHDHSHDHRHTHNPSAHQHGIGHLDLVMEGQQLTLMLQIPAEDLLGFEHAPRTPAEQEQLTAVQATLNNPQKLFTFAAKAQCRLESSELHSGLFANPPRVADDAQAVEHADISAHYQFHCAEAGKLREMEVMLFQQFPGSEKLLLQAITPSGQSGAELSAAHNRIRF